MSTIDKTNAKVEFYRDNSTLSKADIIQIKVEAPTTEEAEELFTKKLKELERTLKAEIKK